MASDETAHTYTSFLGTGWSFPPEFVGGQVRMSEGEKDIDESLRILFGTMAGERLFEPTYGLDMQEVLFEPMSTTVRSFLSERVKIAILIHEPRIHIVSLSIESPDPNSGSLSIALDYEVRATSSRYNLVYPFYLHDGNEVSAAVGVGRR